MYKRILTLVMALAFVVGLSGMALASNTADVDQSGTDNEAYINQVGGSPNNNTIDIDQVAGTTNDAVVYQSGSGNDVDVTLNQNASSGYNNLYVEQLGTDGAGSGDNNDLDLFQIAGTNNDAVVYQWGSDNAANVSQTASLYNNFYVKQNGNSNVLVGANSNGIINLSGAATQISVTSYNNLSCVQSGDGNKAGLYQNALSFNYASITQDNGGNSLVAWQNAPGGSNELTSLQDGGMTAVVIQNAASGNNVASITQQ